MKILIFISTLLLMNSVQAQTASDIQKERQKFYEELQKQMQEDQKMMEKYFKSDFLKKFKNLFGGAMDRDFFDQMDDLKNDDQLGGFFKNLQMPGNEIKHKWVVTKDKKILVLKVELKDNAPFDIKIENGLISINGTVEKKTTRKSASGSFQSTRIYTFSQSYPVPDDVDPAKVNIKTEKGEVRVEFPKIKEGQKAKKPGLKKVSPGKDDITI